MEPRLGVAVIGAGRMGARHAENLARGAHSRVTWIVDPAAEAARPLAERLDARWAPDLGPVLDSGDVDALVIATPSALHAQAVEAGLGAGKALFCEKPLVVGLEATLQLAARIERAAGYFQIGFMRRYDPAYAEARRAVAAGELGRVLHALAISRDPLPPPESYVAVSGGIFLDMGIHDIDLLRWLVGDEITEVRAQGSVGETDYLARHDDLEEAQVLARFGGGASATLLMSRASLYGYDVRTELWGTAGTLAAGYLREPAVTRYDRAGVHHRGVAGFLDRFATAYQREIEDFALRVQNGRPSPAPVADAVAAARVAEACRRSCQSGGAVAVRDVPA